MAPFVLPSTGALSVVMVQVLLEPCAVRVASTVLRGGGGSDIILLPDSLLRPQELG
jgi:hypothetical protein